MFGTLNKCITPQARPAVHTSHRTAAAVQCARRCTGAAGAAPLPAHLQSQPPPLPTRPQGKRLLRLWFARPLVNLAVLEDRLDGVQFFLGRPDAVVALRCSLWIPGAAWRCAAWHCAALCRHGEGTIFPRQSSRARRRLLVLPMLPPPRRQQLRKVKDAPRLLARLQGTQGLPDRRDFLQLQARGAAARAWIGLK